MKRVTLFFIIMAFLLIGVGPAVSFDGDRGEDVACQVDPWPTGDENVEQELKGEFTVAKSEDDCSQDFDGTGSFCDSLTEPAKTYCLILVGDRDCRHFDVHIVLKNKLKKAAKIIQAYSFPVPADTRNLLDLTPELIMAAPEGWGDQLCMLGAQYDFNVDPPNPCADGFVIVPVITKADIEYQTESMVSGDLKVSIVRVYGDYCAP